MPNPEIVSRLQHRSEVMQAGMVAGETWAPRAALCQLVALAAQVNDELLDQPERLLSTLHRVMMPPKLLGDDWREIYLGSRDPAPLWLQGFVDGALGYFHSAFQAGKTALHKTRRTAA